MSPVIATLERRSAPDVAEEPTLTKSLAEVLPVTHRRRVKLQNITLHLPILHNRNKLGLRLPVSLGKFRQTFRELKAASTGFNVSACFGWCAEDGIWDPHIRVDFDADVTPDLEAFLLRWRESLRHRFVQRSIYMSASSVEWVD